VMHKKPPEPRLDEIRFYLVEGDPVCVWCAWELRASGAPPVWWRHSVEAISDRMLVTERWTTELGTLVCRCGEVVLVSEADAGSG
jgi:hypothetical protein